MSAAVAELAGATGIDSTPFRPRLFQCPPLETGGIEFVSQRETGRSNPGALHPQAGSRWVRVPVRWWIVEKAVEGLRTGGDDSRSRGEAEVSSTLVWTGIASRARPCGMAHVVRRNGCFLKETKAVKPRSPQPARGFGWVRVPVRWWIVEKAVEGQGGGGARKGRKEKEVRGLGLEPRTNWLKANCSTN